jgi:DcmR-like sensory protein
VQDPQQPDSDDEFHCVHFFEPSQFPTEPIANFLEQGLRQGEAALLLSSLDHASVLGEKVEEAGWNVLDLRAAGLWDVTDVDEMLRAFKAGTSITAIVERYIDATLRPAQQRSPSKRIRIYGELEDALLSRLGNAEAALTVERYGNRLASEGAAKIYCGYSTNSFPDASFARPFIKLCHLHDRVHNGLTDREDWRFQMAEKMSSL